LSGKLHFLERCD